MGQSARELELTFIAPLERGFGRDVAAAMSLEDALGKARDQLGSLRDSLPGTDAALASLGATSRDVADALEEIGRSAETSTALVVTGLREQRDSVDDLTAAYMRLAFAQHLAEGAGGQLRVGPVQGQGFTMGRPTQLMPVNEPRYQLPAGPPPPSALPPAGGTGAGRQDWTFWQSRDRGRVDALMQMLAERDMAAAENGLDREFSDALASGSLPIPPDEGGGGGGGRDAGMAGGGGRGGGDIFRRLLWGGGSRWGRGRFFPGFVGAGMGSALSFAGLDPLHALTTVGAVAGSAATGLAGAGLLGLGAAGQIAVGGGSDIAVMKSTIADTQTIAKSYDNLQKAVAVYGKNSREAAVAQSQLNAQLKQLGGLGAPGVAAENRLAQSASALGTFWDKATQQARVQAVNILEQVVTLGHDYVPRIAQAAQENLAIINRGVRPLFAWLEGPQGIGIWNNLEDNFRHALPNAVHAFDQGMEILLRVTSIASDQAGRFTKHLDELLTRLNAHSDTWFTAHIDKLIGDFRMWEQLVKALGLDLYYLFRNDAQTGQSIVTTLTAMLTKLGDWERSTRGREAIHNIFEVHKQEVLALLQLLPVLFDVFGGFYLRVAPPLTAALTGIVTLFGDLVHLITELGPLATNLTALALVAGKLGVLGSTLRGVATALGLMTGNAAKTAAANTALAASEEEVAVGAAAEGGMLSRFGLGAMGTSLAGATAGRVAGAVAPAESSAMMAAGATQMAAPLMSGLLGAGMGLMGGSMLQQATHMRGGTAGTLEGGAIGGTLGFLIGGPFGAAFGAAAGSALGPTIGHELDSLFGGHKGRDYGREFASGFTAPLAGLEPPRQLAETDRMMHERINQFNDAWRAAQPHRGPLNEMILPTHQDEQKFQRAAFNLGWTAGRSVIDGLQSVKHPTAFAFTQDFTEQLQKLPRAARPEAAKVMIAYAEQLAANGKLPHDAVRKIISGIETQFPELGRFLQQHAMQTDREWAAAYRLKQAQKTLTDSMTGIRQDFALFNVNPDITGKNWVQNFGVEMKDLHRIAQSTTGATRRDALTELHLLRQQGTTEMTRMTQDVTTKMTQMKGAIIANIGGAQSAAESILTTFAGNVGQAFQSGVLNARDASRAIARALDAALKAFGAKVPGSVLQAMALSTPFSIHVGQFTKAGVGGGRPAGAAQGALMTVGRPGARGGDSIPMNVGGVPIMVGEGEQVAVLTHHQQTALNERLSDVGGLPGFFTKINAPHGPTGAYRGYQTGGYVYPLPSGTTVGRTDMGVDADMPVGAPIGPIGNAEIKGINPNWYRGQPFMWWQLLSGPDAGRYVYVAEQIQPLAAPGQRVGPNQAIARFAPSGTGIEMGWASSGGQTLAQSTTGYTEGAVTPAGSAFRAFLAGLAHGVVTAGGGLMGEIPTPQIHGGGTIGREVQSMLNLETGAANTYLQDQMAKVGFTGPGFAGALPGLSAKGVARNIYNFFTGKGLSKTAIAGIIGNWMQESSLNPASPGGGLAQWIGGRWQALSMLAHQERQNPYSLGVQLQYAWEELSGPYRSALGAIQGAGSPAQAAMAFSNLYERPGIPDMGNRIAFADQAFAQGFKAGGNVVPAHLAHATAASTRGNARVRKPKHHRPHHPHKLPPLKGLTDFDNRIVREINSIDTTLTELGNWQGYIENLHQANPVEPIVTLADGTEVINWHTMRDPSTNTMAKGIDPRLAEIGNPGQATVANPGARSATRDKNTELGIEELFLDAYLHERALAIRAQKKFGPWLQRMRHHVGNMQSRVNRLIKEREHLGPDRQHEDYLVTRKFENERYRLNTASRVSTFDASQAMHDHLLWLTVEESRAGARIPVHPPASWLGDTSGWYQARNFDRAQIRQEFARRRAAVQRSARVHNFQGRMHKSAALHGLQLQEQSDKEAILQAFDARRIHIADELRHDRPILARDKKSYGDATSIRGFGQNILAYLDPMGALSINIDTKEKIDIPAKLNEIAQLKGTTIQPGGQPQDTLSNQLLTQLNAQLRQERDVSQAQYRMLATMPPFAGAYAQGGVVPGPLGEPRLIIAHGGEEYMGVGDQKRAADVRVVLEDHRTKVYVNDVEQTIQTVNRFTARRSARGLPGAGGGRF